MKKSVELGTENPGSNPLSGSSPNVQGNSPAQKPSVTKTRGAPRIYKEINEMTDIDVFSEDLLREFHRDKLTRPAFEEENKTRKFCKPQDIARYLEKQARLLSEKYGKTLELTPYQTGKRASRPSAIERIVEIRSALFSHDKADDSSIKIAAWEGEKNDKSPPNEDFEDDVKFEENLKKNLENRRKCRIAIWNALNANHTSEDGIISFIGGEISTKYILETLQLGCEDADSDRLWDREQLIWERGTGDNEVFYVLRTLDQRIDTDEEGTDAEDSIVDMKEINNRMEDMGTPHSKNQDVDEVQMPTLIIPKTKRGKKSKSYLMNVEPKNITEVLLREHFLEMMGDKTGSKFFEMYLHNISQEAESENWKTQKLIYVRRIRELETMVKDRNAEIDDLSKAMQDKTQELEEQLSVTNGSKEYWEKQAKKKQPDYDKWLKARTKLTRNESMGRKEYADTLKNLGLDLSDQDVFHIIANEHGGADHPDNYLYALGKSFNRSIGSKFDALNCFLAGKEKALKAIKISEEIGNRDDPRGKPVKKYIRKAASLEEECSRLIGEGQSMISSLRAEMRKTRT